MLNHANYMNLSGWETKLLIDLLVQYKGSNNGDMDMTWTRLSKRGWHSRDTLTRARRGLLDGGWVVITRKGWRKIPTLYAVTLWGIDECAGKVVEETPASTPLNFWKLGHNPRQHENSLTRYPCQRTPLKPGNRVNGQRANA